MNQKNKNIFEVSEYIVEALKMQKVKGFPFFAYMGIKDFVAMEDEVLFHLKKNIKGYEVVEIKLDRAKDCFRVVFRNLPFKVIDDVYVDQLADVIVAELENI